MGQSAASDERQEDKNPKKRSRTWGGLSTSVRLIGAGAIVIMLGLSLVPIGLQWVQQEQEYRAVSAEVEAAKAHNADLQATLEKWDDPDYIARQARRRLGFVRPGEAQYTVVYLPVEEVE